MTDETTAAENVPASDSSGTGSETEQFNEQQAAWLKYQAKVEVVREVLARRGVMSKEEAQLLTDCVNAALDGIKF